MATDSPASLVPEGTPPERLWVDCTSCGARQSLHERIPACAYCDAPNLLDPAPLSRDTGGAPTMAEVIAQLRREGYVVLTPEDQEAAAPPPAEGRGTGEGMTDGCPCTPIEPCSANCSCANSVMSGGCQRCCRYGSQEQRLSAAHRIAARLASGYSPSEVALAHTGDDPLASDDLAMFRALANNWTIDFEELQGWAAKHAARLASSSGRAAEPEWASALRRYGGHLFACKKPHGDGYGGEAPCTCGWDALASRLASRAPETPDEDRA